LDNALKYGREGGAVAIACAREGAFVRVSVDDDGSGIAPEERERIFGLGVRGEWPRGAGAGIGLAVVRAIARRAGGDVRAEPSALGGARFVLRLPAG
jgi:signal transduction histidine kinase